MRVLVLTVVHTPLDARIHRRQIGALLDAGHQVVYAAPFQGHGVALSEVDDRLEVEDLPRAERWGRLAAAREARALFRGRGPDADVAIVHDPELLVAVAGLERICPVIWDVHEDLAGSFEDKPWVPGWTARALRVGARVLETVAERRVPLILAEEGYRRRFRRPHPVVPNLPPLPPAPSGPEDDRVVYLGRVSRLRGAKDLVEAGRLLSRSGIVTEVIGPVDAEVGEMMARADEAGFVQVLGFVPNDVAMARLQGALAGLSLLHDHPNYRLSLPTKIAEYQAAGVPVITTPLPAAVRMVSTAQSGLVVPYADPGATAAAVLELAADRERARRMSAAGRRAAEDGQSWDAAAPAFVRFVERVAGQSSP